MSYLISFEGIDGSGTETWSKYTRSLLQKSGYEVSLFRYPDYDSLWGKIIRLFLDKEVDLSTEVQFLTFATDIIKDVSRIREELQAGHFVVTDRYIISTVAYQCAKGFPMEIAQRFVELFDVPEPDLTILLVISGEESTKRKKSERGLLDRHEENTEYLNAVNRYYQNLYDQNYLSKKWVIIDSSGSKEKTRKDVQQTLINAFDLPFK
ncbi:MAG: dTMP kinase [Promethearchaeota archaeon]